MLFLVANSLVRHVTNTKKSVWNTTTQQIQSKTKHIRLPLTLYIPHKTNVIIEHFSVGNWNQNICTFIRDLMFSQVKLLSLSLSLFHFCGVSPSFSRCVWSPFFKRHKTKQHILVLRLCFSRSFIFRLLLLLIMCVYLLFCTFFYFIWVYYH